VWTFVTKLSGFGGGGFYAPRELHLNLLFVIHCPCAELECVECAGTLSIAKHRIQGRGALRENFYSFVRGGSLDDHIAALSQIIGDRMANENIAIGD
jgi:hypothetical protein